VCGVKRLWARWCESGKALDSKFGNPVRPDYLCLFPGCAGTAATLFFSDGTSGSYREDLGDKENRRLRRMHIASSCVDHVFWVTRRANVR